MSGYGGCAAAFHCLESGLCFGELMVEGCGLCARFCEQLGIERWVEGGRSTVAVGTWLYFSYSLGSFLQKMGALFRLLSFNIYMCIHFEKK